MRKLVSTVGVVLFSMALVSSIAANAQTGKKKSAMGEPQFGIKGGANFSNFVMDETDNANMKVGFHGGVYAKLPITDIISLQPELLYSSKGSKLAYNNFIMGSGEYRFNLNYIEMPVLAMVNLGEYVNLHAGPYMAYLAGANVSKLDNNNNQIEDVANLDADDFNRFDIGIAGGVGFTLGVANFGARYSYGFNPVGKKEGNMNLASYVYRDAKNSNVQVYVGFTF